jgi:hypothetical protein
MHLRWRKFATCARLPFHHRWRKFATCASLPFQNAAIKHFSFDFYTFDYNIPRS